MDQPNLFDCGLDCLKTWQGYAKSSASDACILLKNPSNECYKNCEILLNQQYEYKNNFLSKTGIRNQYIIITLYVRHILHITAAVCESN